MQLPAPRVAANAPPDIAITTTAHSMRPAAIDTDADGFAYHRLADGSVYVQWYDRFEFHVSADGSAIRAHCRDQSSNEALHAYLLGPALSVALLHQGSEGLHAAAFEMNGAAVALTGDGGFGKSTLAAHALRAGARLLTDDLLVMNDLMVLPGPARIKLDPRVAANAFGARAGWPMDDERGKHIYTLRDDEYAAEPVRLARIYVLQPDAEAIAVERLSHGDAFHALLEATFDPLEHRAPRLASHMRYHAALVQTIPIFRLHIPRRIAEIGKVLEAIQ
jgi:hypothetical protein